MEKMVSKQFLRSHYYGKKVFITGHTGFKGAWLSLLLQELGASIKGYALPPEYEHGLFALPRVGTLAETNVIADIRDKEKLREEILSFSPDFIFHLAAQPLVRRSYQIPAETFDINVTGTANLLEAAIPLSGKCSIVVVTTDKVYENKEQNILYSEEDALGGYDPYSASKACVELAVSSFRNSFFSISNVYKHHKGIASARAGNVIGGGDYSNDRIIPDIIRCLQKKETVTVRNPKAIRPWQHVLEPLSGYLLLAALLYNDPTKYSKAYNFGPLPNDHIMVSELVEKAVKFWGSGSWNIASSSSAPHEAGLLQLAIERAQQELNWEPKLTVDEAIDWTVQWYKQSDLKKPEFTLQQINTYLSL